MSDLDELHSRLERLDQHLAGVPLREVPAVRRRGSQRRRRQAVAGIVATLAVTGALGLGVTQALGRQALDHNPAVTTSAEPTATPVPSATTGPTSSARISPAPPLSATTTRTTGSSQGQPPGTPGLLVPAAFLTGAEVPKAAGTDPPFERGQVLAGNAFWASAPPLVGAYAQLGCWQRPVDEPFQEYGTRYSFTDSMVDVYEVVSVARTPQRAAAAMSTVRAACSKQTTTVTTDPVVGDGTQYRLADLDGVYGFVHAANTVGETGETGCRYTVMLQRGHLLVTLTYSNYGFTSGLPRAEIVAAARAALSKAEQHLVHPA